MAVGRFQTHCLESLARAHIAGTRQSSVPRWALRNQFSQRPHGQPTQLPTIMMDGHDDAGGGDDCAPRVAERLEPVQYGSGDDVPEALAAVAAHCRDLWDQRTVSLSDAAQRENKSRPCSPCAARRLRSGRGRSSRRRLSRTAQADTSESTAAGPRGSRCPPPKHGVKRQSRSGGYRLAVRRHYEEEVLRLEQPCPSTDTPAAMRPAGPGNMQGSGSGAHRRSPRPPTAESCRRRGRSSAAVAARPRRPNRPSPAASAATSL